jgi:hypothetical protein
MPEPVRFIADKSNWMVRSVRSVSEESSFIAEWLHFRVARLCYVPAGFRLILEPFSLMREQVRFIAHKSSFMARPVRFVTGKSSSEADWVADVRRSTPDVRE